MSSEDILAITAVVFVGIVLASTVLTLVGLVILQRRHKRQMMEYTQPPDEEGE